eukprot:TRINITY_DN2696_c0_g1_i1.p1 TRINITY_DN2696_c0_g1~~TRINITY_DN2696_c0_g1_i1.p1  ORF type:complete len:426 (-),score=116.37 TRINITY_DN2696_c0_g1_i1:102-1379(-)
MPVKSNLKDKLEDDVLDLSLMQLESIPVKDIAPLTKGTTLDLSNNLLTNVQENFSTLNHLIKLDLSKNQIRELPEYFGNLVNLRHLDLYSNQLDRLPVSFAQLKNLKWLDLKNNPLVPALRKAAGPCITNAECSTCAKKVVALMQSLQTQLENEKKRWVLEEKKSLQRRLDAEEAEKERLKAEKKAAAAKRRRETGKEGGGDKGKGKKGGGLNGACNKEGDCGALNDCKNSRVQIGNSGGNGSKSGDGSMRRHPLLFTLFTSLFYATLLLGAVGASALWVYTEGNLSQKSIARSLPLIARDMETSLALSLSWLQASGQKAAAWAQSTWNSPGESLSAAWREFLRRNDVLAHTVNTHLGPYFCYAKKSLYSSSLRLSSWGSSFYRESLLPLLGDLSGKIGPWVESGRDVLQEKSQELTNYVRRLME